MIKQNEVRNGLTVWMNIDPAKGETHLVVIEGIIHNSLKVFSLTSLNFYIVNLKILNNVILCERNEVITYFQQRIKELKESIAIIERIAQYIKSTKISCSLIKKLLKTTIQNVPTTRELDFMNEQLFMESEKLKYYESYLKSTLHHDE